VVEAQACGVAVISTPVGAIPEMVREGGVLVPVHDVAALRTAVLDLLVDGDRRRALGEAGRADALARFDRRTQGAALAGLVRRVAAT